MSSSWRRCASGSGGWALRTGTHGRPISDAERERRLMLSDDPRIWQPLRW